jgi:hypothetical protein
MPEFARMIVMPDLNLPARMVGEKMINELCSVRFCRGFHILLGNEQSFLRSFICKKESSSAGRLMRNAPARPVSLVTQSEQTGFVKRPPALLLSIGAIVSEIESPSCGRSTNIGFGFGFSRLQ